MANRRNRADALRRSTSHQRTPTLLVMALLAGLGVYGHHSDWKLPKFSALTGNGAAERDDWCEEHGVPESQCVECHPDLLPRGKDYGWCKEHGVHELPAVPSRGRTIETDAGCRRCGSRNGRRERWPRPRGRRTTPICKNYRRRIQFASLEAVKKAGVDVGLVDRQPISESVSANGQITYDQTRFASLSSRLPGTVWRVEKNVGDRVRAGEVLALVDAAEVGRAKTELIQALAQEELAEEDRRPAGIGIVRRRRGRASSSRRPRPSTSRRRRACSALSRRS